MLLHSRFGKLNYMNNKMSWKLKINDKIDPKLEENFPDDPYSDITIHTATQQLHLTLAYLSMDSGYFSQIDPATQCIHLKHLPEIPLLAVLRALYGGGLEVSSVADLTEVLKVIEYLDIEEYKQNLSRGLISIHEVKPDRSPLNSIEMLQFCLRNNIVKEYICHLHFQNNLRTLESSKNYLQLGKLSPQNLNYLLLNYLGKEGLPAAKTINTILENYFNRKSIRPADYLDDEQLRPLKQVWEDFHHKISAAKAHRPMTKTYPTSTTRVSAFLDEAHSPQKVQFKQRMQKLSTLPSFNIQSINLGLAVLKSENVSQQTLLDLRLRMLSKQSEQKSKRIVQLQQEMKVLLQKCEIKKERELGELEDITLLQNIARSRKSRENELKVENSISTSENAFEMLRTPSEGRDKTKSTCKITSLFSKKTIYT